MIASGLDPGNRGVNESSSGRHGESRAQAEGGTEVRKSRLDGKREEVGREGSGLKMRDFQGISRHSIVLPKNV